MFDITAANTAVAVVVVDAAGLSSDFELAVVVVVVSFSV